MSSNFLKILYCLRKYICVHKLKNVTYQETCEKSIKISIFTLKKISYINWAIKIINFCNFPIYKNSELNYFTAVKSRYPSVYTLKRTLFIRVIIFTIIIQFILFNLFSKINQYKYSFTLNTYQKLFFPLYFKKKTETMKISNTLTLH